MAEAIAAGELPLSETPDPGIERPRDPSHGDWATTVALRCAKAAKMQPRQVAEIIAARIAENDDIAAVEIAGPGFINLRLSPHALQRVLREAREADRDFGRLDQGRGLRVQVEFVSANPVGPMHVGHGRWAALGDSMARVLEHAGWDVEREFYVNDAGVQMDIFAQVRRRALSRAVRTRGRVRRGVVPGRLHHRDRPRDLRRGGRRAGSTRPRTLARRTSGRRRTPRCSSI